MKTKQRRGESAEFALEEPQVAKTMQVCNDVDDKLTVGCQLFLGLRAGELSHMNEEWITPNGDLRIPSQQICKCSDCARYRGGVWRPKTKAGARLLPIPPQIRKDLLEFLKKHPMGLGIGRVGIFYRTKMILKRAGVRFKSRSKHTGFPHCLRATCAMMLATSGMEAAALCYFMGWKSIAVGDHYIRTARAKDLAFRQAREAFGN